MTQMAMEVVAGDNQGSGKWLADYAGHYPRGMMNDESMV
jgi:hypothetical protein